MPYASRSYPNATVASGGCGPTCISILLENLIGVSFPPPQSAAYAIKCGARVDTGTDMALLSANVARDSGLARTRTDSIDELKAAISDGGMAICNVNGNIKDRSGKLIYRGVFSSGGHYVVVVSIDGNTAIIADPGMYPGKYDGKYRAAQVAVLGDVLSADVSVLDKDSRYRSPRFYLFRKGQESRV